MFSSKSRRLSDPSIIRLVSPNVSSVSSSPPTSLSSTLRTPFDALFPRQDWGERTERIHFGRSLGFLLLFRGRQGDLAKRSSGDRRLRDSCEEKSRSRPDDFDRAFTAWEAVRTLPDVSEAVTHSVHAIEAKQFTPFSCFRFRFPFQHLARLRPARVECARLARASLPSTLVAHLPGSLALDFEIGSCTFKQNQSNHQHASIPPQHTLYPLGRYNILEETTETSWLADEVIDACKSSFADRNTLVASTA